MASREFFVENLRKALAKKNWKAIDLAAKSGLTSPQISRFFDEDAPAPTLATLDRVAEALEVPVSDLLRDPSKAPILREAPKDELQRLVEILGDAALLAALARANQAEMDTVRVALGLPRLPRQATERKKAE